MEKLQQEKTGEIIIFIETIIYSLFPILITHSTKIFPPIFFAGTSVLLASISLFLFLLKNKQLHLLKNTKTIKYSLGVATFIIIIPSILIFIGSSLTSGINTTILLQSEIIFAFLIFGFLKIEKITAQKILGALVVFLGATFIVYNGSNTLNIGDLLIIAGTFFYPIGNIFAKKALSFSNPTTILFIRSLIGGIALLIISYLFEDNTLSIQKSLSNWPLLLFNGIIIYHLSKILWYEGIKRIDITKATVISIGGYPAFSLFFAIILLNEIPNNIQLLGFFTVIFGIMVLTRNTKKLEPIGME